MICDVEQVELYEIGVIDAAALNSQCTPFPQHYDSCNHLTQNKGTVFELH